MNDNLEVFLCINNINGAMVSTKMMLGLFFTALTNIEHDRSTMIRSSMVLFFVGVFIS